MKLRDDELGDVVSKAYTIPPFLAEYEFVIVTLSNVTATYSLR
jgi:hypothetical protein